MNKCRCLVIFLFFVFSFSFAQQGNMPVSGSVVPNIIPNNGSGCGLDFLLKGLRQDPSYRARENSTNQQILNAQRSLDSDSTFLPVVFHIISQSPLAVPDQLILNALYELNDAFAKRGNYVASNGVDTKIRFCLAQKDPDGGIATGITRTESYYSTHLNPVIEDAKLKNLVQWDPARYINIWYVSSMELESFADFACGKWTREYASGYATMPPGGGALDGIVVTGFGNILIHEMGHYLGLYHTFEGRNCANNNCATEGDMVCDTPPDRSVNNSVSCTNPENSCNTDTLSNYSNGNFTSDVPDQISNFMDYGNHACHNEFTMGQALRMNAAINTQRSGLLQNQCDKPCNENIKAVFVRNNPYPLPGDSVSFINNSTGASSYQWLVNDVVVSTNKDFGYTFPAKGKYKVSLKAYNSISCFAIYTDFVIVNCGVISRFYTDKRTIASKVPVYSDSIIFTNTSLNASSYKWLMSNDKGMAEQVVSTANDLTYLFVSPANYSMRLIATNGSCTDTSNIFTIPVFDPTLDGFATMTTVNCYQQTKVRVTINVCNYGFDTIPRNTPISFYDADPRKANAKKLGATFFLPDYILGNCCGPVYTHIIDVQQPGLNTLYMVFNDSGNTSPLVLPNTSLIELNYTNNVSLATNFRFRASILPPQATLEPGDTLQLVAQAGPGTIVSYIWSPALNLSCTNCISPYLVADSDRVKGMIATSQFGCFDTAYTVIKVPPSDDFTLDINDVKCAGSDSLYVNFTIHNLFKRGSIYKGLIVSFYDGDPKLATSKILLPSFTVPSYINAGQMTYSCFIKGMGVGKLFAVVNDSGILRPLILPNTPFLEKDYTNNSASFTYTQEIVQLIPRDTTVMRTSSFPLKTITTIYNPTSTNWFSGNGYSLSCNQCASPVVQVFDNSFVTMQTENKYGCLITGTSSIKIFPPDMTIRIIETNCYSNSTTLVKFELCMNNKYDSVFANIPVSFYDAIPGPGAKLLNPVFYTPHLQAGSCYSYQQIITTPVTNQVYAMVNDKGTDARAVPYKVYNETDYSNNTDKMGITQFKISIHPDDTTIARLGSVQLTPSVKGGSLSSYLWKQDPFLSCTNCLTPIVTPGYTKEYMFFGRNEFGCIDTAYAVVKTETNWLINIPSAFSPNRDGLNDVFYVLGGAGLNLVKDFAVFDRWGKKVFETNNFPPNDPGHGWNGTYNGVEAAPGTYVYYVRIVGVNGKDQIFKGTVILLR